MLVGIAICWAFLTVSGSTVIGSESRQQFQSELEELREENQLLSDELFGPRDGLTDFDLDELPYDEQADAHTALASARASALEQRKILMVTFGANWCTDCRMLSRTLKSDDVVAYTRDRFVFANIDIGKFNKNTDVATELGVNLENGIPVAVFFDASGALVGATNEGQLEPARLYSSKQILKFVRDVAERSRILAPDAVE